MINVYLDRPGLWSTRHLADGSNLAVATPLDPAADTSALEQGLTEASVATMRGHWAAIQWDGESATIASDLLRTVPLYVAHLPQGDVGIYDSFAAAHAAAGGALDPDTADFFIHAGFAPGLATFDDRVQVMPAAALVRVDSSGAVSVRSHEGFPLFGAERLTDADGFADRLEGALDIVMERMLAAQRGHRIVVPLSGGLDSRLLVTWLANHRVNNVLCFTYGLRGIAEVEVSRQVAESLGLDWVGVQMEPDQIRAQWAQPGMADMLAFASSGSALPHVQDWFALRHLKEAGRIDEGDIILPGHTIVGNCHDLTLLDPPASLAQTCASLTRYHVALNPRPLSRGARDAWADSLVDWQRIAQWDGSARSVQRFVEAVNVGERQAKYINNSVHVYEFFGLRWAIPMLDVEFVQTWCDGSVDLTASRDFYGRWITGLYEQATGQQTGLAEAPAARLAPGLKGSLVKAADALGVRDLGNRVFAARAVANHPLGFSQMGKPRSAAEIAWRQLRRQPILGQWAEQMVEGTFHPDYRVP
ncbi:MAG: asparagine synthase-related protein [Actinomycetaceae bacterium]|nr:asparagine synthase-related protein [Actinomycetaceae bacterium]MDU0969750.1 asparagine synthase-related protein [Actinomycetaceae bacterium]